MGAVPKRVARIEAARKLQLSEDDSSDTRATWRRITHIISNPQDYPWAASIAEELDDNLDGARPFY